MYQSSYLRANLDESMIVKLQQDKEQIDVSKVEESMMTQVKIPKE